MKKIKINKNADTRTSIGTPTKEQLLEASEQHIDHVNYEMNLMAFRCMMAGLAHDFDKVTNIDQFHNDFKSYKDGELKNFIEGEWYRNHLEVNRHHDLENVPNVNLIDLLEMVVDVSTSSLARGVKWEDVWIPEVSEELLKKMINNTYELIKKDFVVEE